MTKDEAEKMVDEFGKLYLQNARGLGGGEALLSVRAAIIAALTATPGVPDGWKLVPVEPTWGVDAMSGAGAEALPSAHGVTGTAGQLACNVYRAMLAAAPPAPVVSVADAVAAEREACAKALDKWPTPDLCRDQGARAIRSRGQGSATPENGG